MKTFSLRAAFIIQLITQILSTIRRKLIAFCFAKVLYKFSGWIPQSEKPLSFVVYRLLDEDS